MYLCAKISRQCVDTAYTDAMQTAGDLVVVFVELAAGMEHSEHNLERALVFLFVHVDRDATSVVDDGDGIVGVDGYADRIAISGKSLVDRIVDNLIYKMMETF